MTAAAEQMKITEIRLRRLFVSRGWPLEHSDAAAPSAAASRAGVRAGLLHSHLGAQHVPRSAFLLGRCASLRTVWTHVWLQALTLLYYYQCVAW